METVLSYIEEPSQTSCLISVSCNHKSNDAALTKMRQHAPEDS